MTSRDLLAWLGEASIVLGAAVLLILLVRRAMRGRLSAGWRYALWLAAPVALLATLTPNGLIELSAPPSPAWLPELSFELPPLDFERPAAPADVAPRAATSPLSPEQVALAVWLGVLAALFAARLRRQRRFAHGVVAMARRPAPDELPALARAAAGTRLRADRDVRFTPAIESPLACGLLRPVVLLPEAFLARYSPDEQRIMMLHEAEHIRARHLEHRLLARILRDVFWFHPLAWLAERAFVADQELACDRAALARDRAIRPRIYAATLLKAAARIAGGAPLAPAGIPLVTLGHLKERTIMLARHASIGNTRAAGALVLAAVAALSMTAGLTSCVTAASEPPAAAAAAPSDPDARTFTGEIGEIVVAAQEKMSAEPADYAGAVADLDRALATPGRTPYQAGVILIMRGGVKYQLDDTDGALADWERALDEGALEQSERLNLMYNVAQLHLAQDDFREAADGLEEWIRAGGVATDSVHLMMVAAYVELGDLERALDHARQALAVADPPQKRHYDTLNYLYTEMGMTAERAELLSQMVVLFPDAKNVWVSMVALHAQAGREREAFEVSETMYEKGMLTTEGEIMRVVDYYDHYDDPGNGARVLAEEMAAGRVARNQANLDKLARLTREARE